MTTTKKYAFVTIVAPEAVRAEFTQLRNELKTTDKQLMQALWNLAQSNAGAVAHEVEGLKEVAAQLKHIKAITVGDEPKVAIAELTPITAPVASTSGPPLFPGLIAASV